MDEVTKTEGSTTINQYPNGSGGWNGWGGPWSGGWGYPVAVPTAGYGYGYGGGGLGEVMRGFGGNINIGRGGNALGVVGTVLGAVALGIPILRGGLFGGPGNGGGGGPGCDFVTQRELGLVEKNNTLSAENGQLKAQIYTDNKIDGVVKTLVEWRQRQEFIDNTASAEIAALKQENANIKAKLGAMLGEYIQPQVMIPSQTMAAQVADKTSGGSGTGS